MPSHAASGRLRPPRWSSRRFSATFPFWPASLTTPIAILCGGLALFAPWSAALLVVAVCVPALGNLSSALAWAFALAGVLWLSVSAGSGRRALLPALAPAALALFAFPLYLIVAGRLRTAPGRALAGAAGPLAIALWAAHANAATYTGTDDVAAVLRALEHGAGAPLLGQALAWGAVAMAWPLAWSGWRVGRAASLTIWLCLALAAQALVPAALGAAPEAALRSAGAVAAAAILLALSVPARGDEI